MEKIRFNLEHRIKDEKIRELSTLMKKSSGHQSYYGIGIGDILFIKSKQRLGVCCSIHIEDNANGDLTKIIYLLVPVGDEEAQHYIILKVVEDDIVETTLVEEPDIDPNQLENAIKESVKELISNEQN